MIEFDPKGRAERARWLLGRYPDVTPEELREITAHLKQSPALAIELIETQDEVKPVFVRLRQEQAGNDGAVPWLDGLVMAAIIILAGGALWNVAVPE